MKKLQDIRIDGMETSAPGFDELCATLNSLKNGKAANDIPAGYLKYAKRSDKLVNEMVNIYDTNVERTSQGEYQRPHNIKRSTNWFNTL